MGCDLADLSHPQQINMQALQNKVLAVDGNNTLYQFLSSIRGADGTPLMDSKGRLTGHLTGLFYRTTKWLEAGLRPAFVFDGKPPEFKSKTLEQRRKRKIEAQKKMELAIQRGDLEAAKSFAQQTSKLTPKMVEQAAKLLEGLGIPYIIAPAEGEAEAADLVSRELAWASASQDFDSLLFGSKKLLRNLSITGRRKVPKKAQYVQIDPEIIELEIMLQKNSLTRSQLIWIALLSGTDFNKGIYRIGPKKALKLVKDEKNFGDAIKKLPQNSVKKDENGEIIGLEGWEQIEKFFLHPPTSAKKELKFSEPSPEKVIKVLVDEHDFSKDRVERTLQSLQKTQKEKGGQTTLGDW